MLMSQRPFLPTAPARSQGRRLRSGVGILAILCLAGMGSPARADTAAGLADFQQGEFAEAQTEWRAAAAQGDATAALFIGVSYDVGEGVAPDVRQAAAWYATAAKLGNPAAMFNLAVCYDTGRGVERDPTQAIAWYEQAANQDYARADYNLGLIYLDGSGVPRDQDRAVYWFRRAYSRGIAAAKLHLGKREGTLRHAELAPEHAENSSMQAFQQAQAILLNRTADKLGQAVSLFRTAAENNNPLAAYDLAYCYENGIGVRTDRMAAYRWYRRAAAQAQDDGLRSIARSSATALAQTLSPEAARHLQAQVSQ